MSQESKHRILLQALEIVGDQDQLAKMMGVRDVQMLAWICGAQELPDTYFLKALDICMDHNAPSLWGEPGPSSDQPPEL